MIKKLKYIRFDIAGLGFIVLAILFMVVAFVGRLEINTRKQKETSYCEKEQELITSVKDFLSQKGYTNCGVTMTRVMDESGIRHYTLTVHHDRISKMNATEKITWKKRWSRLHLQIQTERSAISFSMNWK